MLESNAATRVDESRRRTRQSRVGSHIENCWSFTSSSHGESCLARGIHSGREAWFTLWVVIDPLSVALKALLATLPDRRRGDNTM